MRRLSRILLNTALVASLALCVATAWLWATSYLLGWQGAWETNHADGLGDSGYSLEVSGGGVRLAFSRSRVSPTATADFIEMYRSLPRSAPDRFLRRTMSDAYPNGWRADGRRWSYFWDTEKDRTYVITRREAVGPCWVAFILAAAAPGWWLARRVRKRRTIRLGLCPDCGYDCRATPERCPECGTVAAKT